MQLPLLDEHDLKLFDPDKEYIIEGKWLRILQKIAKQLYREERLSGDQQRDMAQLIREGLLEHVEERP